MVAPPSLLQPLHIPTQKWSEVSMDFISGLPTSEGKDSIFVFIEILTKYVHFISISSKSKAIQVAYSYAKNIFKINEFPKVIVSDRDSKFTNNFQKELFHQVWTSLTMSTLYHTQTHGKMEVVNKFLEGYLRNFVNDQQN